MNIALWIGTVLASVFITTMFIFNYMGSRYGEELKKARQLASEYAKAYQREKDANTVLRQRYRSLWAECKGEEL